MSEILITRSKGEPLYIHLLLVLANMTPQSRKCPLKENMFCQGWRIQWWGGLGLQLANHLPQKAVLQGLGVIVCQVNSDTTLLKMLWKSPAQRTVSKIRRTFLENLMISTNFKLHPSFSYLYASLSIDLKKSKVTDCIHSFILFQNAQNLFKFRICRLFQQIEHRTFVSCQDSPFFFKPP